MKQRREERAADDSLVGRDLCRAWTADVDAWRAGVLGAAVDGGVDGRGGGSQGIALVAVGGYGRGELSLQSDIDLLLLHRGRPDFREVADRVWYPIWDAGMKLGHAVRTVDEALALAAADLDTATALLDSRLIAGDAPVADELAAKALRLWQKRAR